MAAESESTAREAMVERDLRARDIKDEHVLQAMLRVPREQFLPASDAEIAYEDRALGIDCGQTISQPYIVALMTQLLQVSPGMRVLEVGTGSGYQAAVLAVLGAEVFTIERHPPLARVAAERLIRFAKTPVQVVVGDGRLGWPAAAPYDRAIITAATQCLPAAVWEQLREGGQVVLPIGPASQQTLMTIRKIAGQEGRQHHIGCRFVPLLPDVASEAP